MATAAGPVWSQAYNLIELGTLQQGTSVVVRGPNPAGTAFGGGLPQSVLGGSDLGGIVGSANTSVAVRAFAGARSGSTRE
jgi:hypothetical protein